MFYPTASLQMKVPPFCRFSCRWRFSLPFPAVPSALIPCQPWDPYLWQVSVWSHILGISHAFASPAPCAYVDSSPQHIPPRGSLDTWRPEGPTWGFPLASRLSSSKEHSGGLSSTQLQAMHKLSWHCPRSGYKGSRPCLHLGSRPYLSKSPQLREKQ